MNRFALLLLCGAWFLTGCSSGGGDKAPSKANVAGKVLLDGKPMPDGEIRFSAAGQPVVTLPIAGGSFSGEVYTGKNLVGVVREKDGPPHPMDPSIKLKVNTVSDQYSGGNSIINADVPEAGKADLKFEVMSARR